MTPEEPAPYEPPRIDDRATIGPILVGYASNVCAAFRP
jgi:hypothetical protein